MSSLEGLIILLLLIGLFIGLIYLQYRICKGEHGRKLGLILPILCLALALLTSFGFWATSAVRSTGTTEVYDDEGNFLYEEQVEETEVIDTASSWIGFGVLMVLCNIPTLIYCIEYFVITSGKKKELLEAAELERTQIQDL